MEMDPCNVAELQSGNLLRSAVQLRFSMMRADFFVMHLYVTDPYIVTICPTYYNVGWLVGFGFKGPLRQYFSLYRAVSQREGERGERIDESKNVQINHPHPHLLQAQWALVLL